MSSVLFYTIIGISEHISPVIPMSPLKAPLHLQKLTKQSVLLLILLCRVSQFTLSFCNCCIHYSFYVVFFNCYTSCVTKGVYIYLYLYLYKLVYIYFH